MSNKEQSQPEREGSINRGYYTVARRYEFYVRVARTISHSFAALTREIALARTSYMEALTALEHSLHSSEEFTIRTTHLSPGSSSAQ